MSGKRKDRINLQALKGVVTFFGSHHALRAEEVLKKNNMQAVLIPGPREISPNCGVALRFDYARREEVERLFTQFFVHYEDIHLYPDQG